MIYKVKQGFIKIHLKLFTEFYYFVFLTIKKEIRISMKLIVQEINLFHHRSREKVIHADSVCDG